jgi:hypothetical protein
MRIDLDCLSVVRYSAIDVPFSPVGGSTVVVSAGVPRIDRSFLMKARTPEALPAGAPTGSGV